jgi:WD40 repeat protein
VSTNNPFPGPRPYSQKEREVFSGRDSARDSVVAAILAYRSVTLFGPSGSGKSSLVQAAIVPVFEDEHGFRIVRVDAWPLRTNESEKSRSPASKAESPRPEQLSAIDWLCRAIDEQLELGSVPPNGNSLAASLDRASERSSQPILVVLDQLEQVLIRAPEDMTALLKQLEMALAEARAGIRVLLSVREDHLGRLRDRLRAHHRLREHAIRLGAFTVGQIVTAAVDAARKGAPAQQWAPAWLKRYMLQVRTPGEPANDTAEVQTAYAQVVCRALFAERARNPVGSSVELDAEVILHGYLESALASLGSSKDLARRLLEYHLVSKDGLRTLVTEHEATAEGGKDAIVVLEKLDEWAVVRGEAHQSGRYFELGHDWLASWVFKQRKRRRRQRRARINLGVVIAPILVVGGAGFFVQALSGNESLARQKEVAEEQADAAGRGWERARLSAAQARAREALARREPEIAAEFAEVVSTELPEADSETNRPVLRTWLQLAYDVLALRRADRVLTSQPIAGFDDQGNWLVTIAPGNLRRLNALRPSDGAKADIGVSAEVSGLAVSASGVTIVRLAGDKLSMWKPLASSFDELVSRPELRNVAVGPRGKYFAATDADGSAYLWDLDDPHARPVPLGHSGDNPACCRARTSSKACRDVFCATAVGFDRKDERVAVGYGDGSFRVYESSRPERDKVFKPHGEAILFVRFSVDGTKVVTGSADKMANVTTVDGAPRTIQLKGHDDDVVYAELDRSGHRVVTASADQSARIWSLDDAKPGPTALVTKAITLGEHRAELREAHFSSDGARVLTIASDDTPRIWNILEGNSASVPLQGHTAPVRGGTFDASGDHVVTWASDGTVRIWATVDRTSVVARFPTRALWGDASPSGDRIAVALDRGGVAFLKNDGSDAGVLATADNPDGGARSVWGLGFARYGDMFAYGVKEGSIHVVSEGTDREVLAHDAGVNSLAFGTTSDELITGWRDGLAIVIDPRSGEVRARLSGHRAQVTRAVFSPDGRTVVTTSGDGLARTWRADTWEPDGGAVLLPDAGREPATPSRLASVAFHPDGKQVAIGAADGTVVLRDVSSGAVIDSLRGHEGSVNAIVFDDKGTRIVTGSDDHTVRIWQKGDGPGLVLRGHEGAVQSAFFLNADGAPGDSIVISVGSDGTVRSWPLSRDRVAARLRSRLASCLPVEDRKELGYPPEEADRGFKRCEELRKTR